MINGVVTHYNGAHSKRIQKVVGQEVKRLFREDMNNPDLGKYSEFVLKKADIGLPAFNPEKAKEFLVELVQKIFLT